MAALHILGRGSCFDDISSGSTTILLLLRSCTAAQLRCAVYCCMFCVLVVLLGLCVHSSTAALGVSRVSWNLLLRNIIICSPGDTSSKRLHIPPSKTHISQIIFSRNIFDNFFGPRQPKYLSKIFLVRNGLITQQIRVYKPNS